MSHSDESSRHRKELELVTCLTVFLWIKVCVAMFPSKDCLTCEPVKGIFQTAVFIKSLSSLFNFWHVAILLSSRVMLHRTKRVYHTHGHGVVNSDFNARKA